MKNRSAIVACFLVLMLWAEGAWGNPSPWRALVVYTNAAQNELGPVNIYDSHVTGIIDEINLIYESSEMTTRGEIAGVIMDSLYVGVNSDSSVKRLLAASHGMGKYVHLLSQYSADILILRDVEPVPTDVAGRTTYLSEWLPKGYAALWVDTENSEAWAHEIGHIYGANHCQGFRQTYDSLGGFTSQHITHAIPACQQSALPPSTGFHTIMAYINGNSCYGHYPGKTVCPTPNCQPWFDPGRLGFFTTPARIFSNPNIMWTHPETAITHKMGIDSTFTVYNNDPSCNVGSQVTIRIRRNVAGLHEDVLDTVTSFRSTPSTLSIADTLAVRFGEYADFRALESAVIEPGFTVREGGRLRIQVGQEEAPTLAKMRSSSSVHGRASETNEAGSSEVFANYNAQMKVVNGSIFLAKPGELKIVVHDMTGRAQLKWRRPVANGLSPFSLDVSELKNGGYLLSIEANGKASRRFFVKL